MKKAIAVLLLTVFSAAGVIASEYHGMGDTQNVRVMAKGPALLASVSNGMMYELVIGYKDTGILAKNSSVNAVVRVTYTPSGQQWPRTTETSLTIQRDWSNSGFLTAGITPWALMGKVSGTIEKIELAFNANGQWDSVYGANYTFYMEELNNTRAAVVPSPIGTSISANAWTKIVDQLKY